MMNHTVTVSPEVMAQKVVDELVLLDMASEKYFVLNGVGTRIWELIRDKKDLQTVFDTLRDDYEVESARLAQDLEELLKKLVDFGLIRFDEKE